MNESIGLPISPYFSALKIKWLKDNLPEIDAAFAAKTCLVGTIDSWIIWVRCGFVHVFIIYLYEKSSMLSFYIFTELNRRCEGRSACN